MTVSDWRLLDEREFLRRSLEDAAREHAAGDLSDEDYALLCARDERRLAEVEAALAAPGVGDPGAREEVRGERAGNVAPVEPAEGTEQVGPGGPVALVAPVAPVAPAGRTGRPGRRRLVFWRRRWWLAAAGLALVVSGAVLLVVDLSAPRLPGEGATGTIDLNTAQKVVRQLAQAQVLLKRGEDVQALALYGQVLTEDPRQPVALTEWGWLDWRAATKAKEQTVAAEGASALVEAVRVDPGLAAAQYYLGTVLLQEGDPAKAVVHYRRFLADRPGSAWIGEAAPEIRAAYAALHRPPPAGLPGA